VKIDLNRPMKDILAELSKYPVSTRLSLERDDYRGQGYRTRQTKGTD